MLRLLGTTLFSALIAVAPAGADTVFRKGLTIDKLDQAFRTAVRKAAAGDFVIAKLECEGAVEPRCMYLLPGRVVLMGVADKPKGAAKQLVLGANLDDLSDLMIPAVVMVAVLSPELPKERRGDMLLELFENTTAIEAEVVLGKVRYSRAVEQGNKLVIRAEPL